jgi:hypothetical protein
VPKNDPYSTKCAEASFASLASFVGANAYYNITCSISSTVTQPSRCVINRHSNGRGESGVDLTARPPRPFFSRWLPPIGCSGLHGNSGERRSDLELTRCAQATLLLRSKFPETAEIAISLCVAKVCVRQNKTPNCQRI